MICSTNKLLCVVIVSVTGLALVATILRAGSVVGSKEPDSSRPDPVEWKKLASHQLRFVPTRKGGCRAAECFELSGSGSLFLFKPGGVEIRSAADSSGSEVHIRFQGSHAHPKLEGLEQLSGVVNDYRGNDSSKWRTGLPTFGAISYRQIYPGIDLIYRGAGGRLKTEFRVAAWSDPTPIRIAYSGVSSVSVGQDGSLVIESPVGQMIEAPPEVYQQIDGMRSKVESSYQLLGEKQVGFEVGEYDRNRELVIDPELIASFTIGGSGLDLAMGSAVGPDGNVVLVGLSNSSDFPTENAEQGSYGGASLFLGDAIVLKFDPETEELIFSTYLGASGDDQANAVVVDAEGNAYVTGSTDSTNIPTMDPLQPSLGGLTDAFLGGSSTDQANALAVDSFGNRFVTGFTLSSDFPLADPVQDSYGGAGSGFTGDAFVSVIGPGGELSFSTYLGGSQSDAGQDIVVLSSEIVPALRIRSRRLPLLARQIRIRRTLRNWVTVRSSGSWGMGTALPRRCISTTCLLTSHSQAEH